MHAQILGSLTIAKFNGVSVHCFFFQLCTYTTFEYLVCILLYVDNLHKCYNFTGIQREQLCMCKQWIPGHLSPSTWPGYKQQTPGTQQLAQVIKDSRQTAKSTHMVCELPVTMTSYELSNMLLPWVMLKLLHNSQCVQTACYLKLLGKIF